MTSEVTDGVTSNERTAAEALSADIESITYQIRRALECPICLLFAANLSCFCPNGHAVCDVCLVQLWNRNYVHSCPMCRSPMVPTVDVSTTSIKLAEAVVMVRVACTNRRYGCPELVPVYEVSAHEKWCAYMPNIRCLVSVCQWSGVYDQLFDHVSAVHQNVIVDSPKNRLFVNDAHTIASNQRRTYLVRSPSGLFWVLLSRESRSRIRTGVFMVDNSDRRPGGPSTADSSEDEDATRTAERGLPGIAYRITWSDNEGVTRTRGKTRWVSWSSSLKEDGRVVGGVAGADPYTMIRSRTGRVEIHWYRPTQSVRNNRRRSASAAAAETETVPPSNSG